MGVMEIVVLLMVVGLPALLAIGVVLALVAFARRQSTPPSGFPCEGCNGMVRPGDKFCAHCGQPVWNAPVGQ